MQITSFIIQKKMRVIKTGLINRAIGSAVTELTSKGIPVNKENILYELERVAASSNELQTKIFVLEAAKLLRKSDGSSPN